MKTYIVHIDQAMVRRGTITVKAANSDDAFSEALSIIGEGDYESEVEWVETDFIDDANVISCEESDEETLS